MLYQSHQKYYQKRVTDERIKSESRKKEILFGEKDLETAIDNLVSSNKLEIRGNDSNKIYFITTYRDDIILFPQTQQSGCEKSVMKIQFTYLMKPPTLMKHHRLLLRRLTFSQAMMKKIELVVSSRNYNHLRISSHRLKIS